MATRYDVFPSNGPVALHHVRNVLETIFDLSPIGIGIVALMAIRLRDGVSRRA